ncbi:DNA primase [Amylibacter marinus]|uniref:DNA primase n=1 Tax=Amylibacter marinus TaxID=1475483 RepID=A0ABQ5VU19_9RHOB|nr:DNA primase [Amylibacter marinus]GLQ34664.1 DNA primase [Amylibacter marinus]
MSLPDGFIEELRNRLSLSSVVGRKVMWDTKKSNTAKGDFWSPCPFHSEKTASFHVDDRKGFYYCFGCHEKGDAITFVRNTENVGFMEAIEILAREAGMTMPARDPQAQKKIDRNKVLADVMEQAVQFYRLQYNTAQASDARDYIQNRGLSQQTQDTFEIGFAPSQRGALSQHLRAKGVDEAQIIDAGLAIKPDDGGAAFDRFRGRIMFPIRDARGRCIAFGGRAMDPNARAKYLNSNETALFDKGRSLYNHAPAREAAGKADSLIVAEGYMDVIALAQFGFKHAVAPLGTAITEGQLALMWRMHPEPIIALDGDTAGLRAALRLIDLALPLIEPDKSLRFCIMPEGKDPDDLLKADGADAMQALLDSAQPMVNLLWKREIDGKVFDSPERRAALDASLRTAIRTIKNPSVRQHYGAAIKELRDTLFAPAGSAKFPPRGPFQPWSKRDIKHGPTEGVRSSILGGQSDQGAYHIREAVILVAALRNPAAALTHEAGLERCQITTPELKEIMNCLLANLHIDLPDTDGTEILVGVMQETLGYSPLERLFQLKPIQSHPFLHASADPEKTERTLQEELAKHSALIGASAEIRDAEQELLGLADEGLTWRLQQAADAKVKATAAIEKEGATAGEDVDAMKKQLQNMLDDQVWVKKKH